MAKKEGKTLGVAIDEIIGALEELESNARTTAVTAACAHLGITLDKTIPSGPVQSNVPGATLPPHPPPILVTNIKTLMQEKMPRGAGEMACLVAYYLQELAQPQDAKTQLRQQTLGSISYRQNSSCQRELSRPWLTRRVRATSILPEAVHID